MNRDRFFINSGPIKIENACALVGGRLINADKNRLIKTINSIENPCSDGVIYIEDKSAARKVLLSEFLDVGLCITNSQNVEILAGLPLLVVEAPRPAFVAIARQFFTERGFSMPGGNPKLGAECIVHSSAVLGPDVEIGAHTIIEPNVVIGPGCIIGEHTRIGAGSTIVHSTIGSRVIIGNGCRLGGIGFGLYPDNDGLVRMPHYGSVIIEDNVEIDANCTVDRGAIDDTKVGYGTKIDCGVHIAHNVILGSHCVIAAQSGVSGSSKLGNRVQMGGKVGIADHLVIGDDVQIAGASGVMHNIPAGEKWGGYPATTAKKWLRGVAMLGKITSKKTESKK